MFDNLLGRYKPGRDPLRTGTARELLAALESRDMLRIGLAFEACAEKSEVHGEAHSPAKLFEADARYIDALAKTIASRHSLELIAVALRRMVKYVPDLPSPKPGSTHDLALRVAELYYRSYSHRHPPLRDTLGAMEKLDFDTSAARQLMANYTQQLRTSDKPKEWVHTVAPSAPSTDPNNHPSFVSSADSWVSTEPMKRAARTKLALKSGRSTTTGIFSKDTDSQQQEIATTSALAHRLRERIMTGDATLIRPAFVACTLRARNNPYMSPEALFANDGHNADILALSLARCQSWDQFDDVLEVALKYAPNLKTLRYDRDQQTLASKYFACALEMYRPENWYKVTIAMRKFKTSGMDVSNADIQIRDTHLGNQFGRYMQTAGQGSERM